MTTDAHDPDPKLLRAVQDLEAEGKHLEAARALLEGGQPGDAGVRFERLFAFDEAIAAFEAAGRFADAARAAIAANDSTALSRLVDEAIAGGDAAAVADALARAGRHAELGRLKLARGEMSEAAQAFQSGALLDQAADAWERAGDGRRAGQLFEEHLARHPDDRDAAMRLGRILAHFARYDDAIAMLQKACGGEAGGGLFPRAAPTLILCFVGLGYEVAAAEVLSRWRKHAEATEGDPPPESLEAFLQSDHAMAFMTAMVAGEMSSSQTTSGPREVAGKTGIVLTGRYLLGEPLASSGVGQVFRAMDLLEDKAVVVKIYGASVVSSAALREVAREARAAAALDHAGVARLVEFNLALGFSATEAIVGTGLEETLRAGGDAGWLGNFFRNLLGILGDFHRAGLVHGAIKPTNVFRVHGGVRIADFGAHHLLATRSTETGGLQSGFSYLSPEQLAGAGLDTATDLYAVAAIIYRSLTGRPPYVGVRASRSVAPPVPSELNPALTPAWDAFFQRALNPHRDKRFADAADMAEALPGVPADFLVPASEDAASDQAPKAAEEEVDRYRLEETRLWASDEGTAFLGVDQVSRRPILALALNRDADLDVLRRCADAGHVLQPIYDVLPSRRLVVMARLQGEAILGTKGAEKGGRDFWAHPLTHMRALAAAARTLENLDALGIDVRADDFSRWRWGRGLRLALSIDPLPRVFDASTSGDADAPSPNVPAFHSVLAAWMDLSHGDDDDQGLLPRVVLALMERGHLSSQWEPDLLRLAEKADLKISAFLTETALALRRSLGGRVLADLLSTHATPSADPGKSGANPP
jgi:hypothetical protein